MTLKTFTSEHAKPSDLNKNFLIGKILLAGQTGCASSATGTVASTPVTDTDNVESADISAAALGNADYLVITIPTYVTESMAGSGVNAETVSYLQIQTKDLPGAYSDTLAESIIYRFKAGSGVSVQRSIRGTYTHIHTLTANEKANGVKIKLISKAYASYDSSGPSTIISTITLGTYNVIAA
jgi:hypothetical protein